jgi:membrane associated rhomboid family serine protease
MSILEDIKWQFKARNVLMQLIIVNVAVFLLIRIFALILFMSGYSPELLWATVDEWVVKWLALPYDPHQLLYRPWTIFTHFFLHLEFAHLFWNMIILFFFGTVFVQYASNARLLAVYVYGALTGAVLSFLSYQFIPNLHRFEPASVMLGASGGIMAIILATATLVPNMVVRVFFLFEVQLKYVAAFFVAIDVISLPYYNNSGGHFAHLGGALFGYLFMSQYKKGRDWSRWFNRSFDLLRSPFSRSGRSRMKVVHTRTKKSDEEYALEKNKLQQRVDEILDKISRSGYESLTKEEKEILFRSSNKL